MPARYGSDLIVDLLKALGIEYVALNPGSSLRGIHDSPVNYNGNRNPEIILGPSSGLKNTIAAAS